MRPFGRNLTRCLVCGFTEVRTDEAVDRGLVFLAECPRCDHRWTSPAPPSKDPEVARRVGMRSTAQAIREVVPAA
jgi:Zn ribbon nucleic-acid-binding protein